MQDGLSTTDAARPLSWGAIISGALVASCLAAVILGFAAAIGLATGSTSPSWRDASVALWLLSGLFLILTAAIGFGVGGYVTGRLATPFVGSADEDHAVFWDGVHGLLMWGLAVLIGAVLASAIARPAPVSDRPAASTSGETLLAYELDRLFRGDRRTGDTDIEPARSEAARILLTSSSHDGVAADDRTYLTRLVAARTGLVPAEAERRVTTAIDRSKETIARARRSAVITAFMSAAALLIGAAIAWAAAREGALDRAGRLGSPFAALFRTHRRL
jgi:hypothetical protein